MKLRRQLFASKDPYDGTKADLFLAGCTQLIGVILAKSMCKPELYKSVRKLVKSAC